MLARLAPILITLTAATVAFAQPPDPPRSPPPEAFEACSSLHEGDACVVKLGDTDLDGICHAFRDEGLACRPNHMPPPRVAEKGDPS
jgi:hypothetical protein